MEPDAREIRKRSKQLERDQERLRRDRDRAIARAVKGGMPVADVGEAFGISQQHVSQIVKGH